MTSENEWESYSSQVEDSQESSGGPGCGCGLFMLLVVAGIAIAVTYFLGILSFDSLPFIGGDDTRERQGDSIRLSSPSDRAILVVLYNATDGDNWVDNENWLSDKPIQDWYGVTTTSSGRVTALGLRGNLLSGEIPAEIGNLADLVSLDLYDCRPSAIMGHI